MGFFGTLKTVVNIATLGQVSVFEKQLEIGGRVVEVTIDVANEFVRVGDEIFRKIPGEALFPGLGPLAGYLKNEVEDELIVLSPLGLVPSLTVFIDGALIIGDLLGVVQHRTMRDDEREVARCVFGASIERLREIRLTNLAGFKGLPFVVPTHAGGAVVNLGGDYVHDGHIRNLPLLIHELTHVWQIQRDALPELFLCSGALVGIENLFVDVYEYEPGAQWSGYGLEQQAHIVQDWLDGERASRRAEISLGSPLFRYVNGNVRTKDNDARTAAGGSVRTWLEEAGADTNSLRRIIRPRPDPYFTSPPGLPGAALEVRYRRRLTTMLGRPPIAFSVSGGELPPGIALSPAGTVAGVPDVAGTFGFTVVAADVAGHVSEQVFTLQVS